MKKKIKHAIITAAGYGKRLHPFTRVLPKALMPVSWHDERLELSIERIIRQLTVANVREISIVTGYNRSAIYNYLGGGTEWGVNINYVYQNELVGEGHAIYQVSQREQEPTIIVNADNFFSSDEVIKDVIETHINNNAEATIAVTTVEDTSPYAVVVFKDGMIKGFVEKPALGQVDSKFIKTGLYVVEPTVFNIELEELMSASQQEYTSTNLFQILVEQGREVTPFFFHNGFADIGTWGNYKHVLMSNLLR